MNDTTSTTKLSSDDFAAKIKAQYPQYQNIDNSTLTQKFLAKYPTYADRVDTTSTTATPTPPADNRDFLTKASDVVGSIFPGKQLGTAIGNSAYSIGQDIKGGFQSLTGNKAGAAQSFQNSQMAADQNKNMVLPVAGDVAKIVATAGGLATPLPVATTLPQAIGRTALQTAGFSALSGAGDAATKAGANIKTIASGAFWSGLTGAVVGGALGAASYGLQKFLDKGPNALYNNALNVSKKIKAAGKSPADFLADEGVWGSLGTMSKTAEQGISDEGDVIAQKVASSDAVSTWDSVKQDAIEQLQKKFGNLYSGPQLEQLVEGVPVASLKGTPDGTFDMSTLNQTRSQLGRLVGDTKWLQSNPTENTSAAQAVYRAMADQIKENTDTAEEFARQSQWIEAKKAIGNALLLADKKWLPGFYDWTSGAVGSVVGMFGGNPVAGGLTGVAVERAARFPAVLTGVAQAISKLPEATAPVLGQIGRTAAASGIGKIFGQ